MRAGGHEILHRQVGRITELITYVAFALAANRRVDGDRDRTTATRLGARNQIARDQPVTIHVQLKPPAAARLAGHVFHRRVRQRRQHNLRIERRRGPAAGNLSIRVRHAMVGRRSQHHRPAQPLPKNSG